MNLSDNIAGILGFLKIAIIILGIAHFCACILNLIATVDYEELGVSWFESIGIDREDWTSRYLSSIYWAVATMTTIGYGDVVPVTKNEKLFAIFAMLLASVIFAYTMSSIGSVIN